MPCYFHFDAKKAVRPSARPARWRERAIANSTWVKGTASSRSRLSEPRGICAASAEERLMYLWARHSGALVVLLPSSESAWRQCSWVVRSDSTAEGVINRESSWGNSSSSLTPQRRAGDIPPSSWETPSRSRSDLPIPRTCGKRLCAGTIRREHRSRPSRRPQRAERPLQREADWPSGLAC